MKNDTSFSQDRRCLPAPAELDEAIDALSDGLVAVRRHLHAHPELSGREIETTRYLQSLFSDPAFQVTLGPEGRGLIVDLIHKPQNTSPETAESISCIALRADIDALPIQDSKTTHYASKHYGVMHACGHDAHAATVYGALMGFRQLAQRGVLARPVHLRGIFQPAEETNRGALEMMSAGAVDNVQALLSLHMDPSRQAGSIGYRSGTFTADCDEMIIVIRGRGGHASRPHESLDPIAAAAQLISSIYLFVPRAVQSHEPVIVTIGHIAGGSSYNVIPDSVVMRGTVRCLGGIVRSRTWDHIRQLARGIAEASGTTIEVTFTPGPPSVLNDPELTELIHCCACDLLGEDRVEVIARASMGGEDFAHYLTRVPGAMFRLGCAHTEKGGPPLHSPQFDIDESALAVGAKILARCVLQWSQKQASSNP